MQATAAPAYLLLELLQLHVLPPQAVQLGHCSLQLLVICRDALTEPQLLAQLSAALLQLLQLMHL